MTLRQVVLPACIRVFSATTIDGNDQSTDRNINGDRFITLFANNQGGYFYCKPMKASGNWDITGGTLFFPNSLGRSNKNGQIITTRSYYWTATAGNHNAAPVLCLRNNVVSPPGGVREMLHRRFSDGLADFQYVQSGNSVKRLVNTKERGGQNSLPPSLQGKGTQGTVPNA